MANRPAPALARRGALVALLIAPLAGPGCSRGPGGPLVVATDLTGPECTALGEAFAQWRSRHEPGIPVAHLRIDWVRVLPGADPSQVAATGRVVDVVLGGLAEDFRRRESHGVWEAADAGGPPWLSLLRTGRGGVPDDPRRDPLALANARDTLATAGWSSGYAALIEQAARSGVRARLHASWAGGVALTRSGRAREPGRRLLRFLADSGRAKPPGEVTSISPGAEVLLSDLLGATLVDARDELVGTMAVLEAEGRPDRPMMWMTRPPTWPPASVVELARDDPSGALVEALAGQVAPDLDVRFWLLASWEGPERPIDAAMLETLAGAVDGKLAAEPRFRAWIRAEWTAWARQRYRRAARLSGEGRQKASGGAGA